MLRGWHPGNVVWCELLKWGMNLLGNTALLGLKLFSALENTYGACNKAARSFKLDLAWSNIHACAHLIAVLFLWEYRIENILEFFFFLFPRFYCGLYGIGWNECMLCNIIVLAYVIRLELKFSFCLIMSTSKISPLPYFFLIFFKN